jgi:hypothetical protein
MSQDLRARFKSESSSLFASLRTHASEYTEKCDVHATTLSVNLRHVAPSIQLLLVLAACNSISVPPRIVPQSSMAQVYNSRTLPL